MKKVIVVALFLLAACRHPELPTGQFMLRIDGPWATPRVRGGRAVRTAPATLLVFRNDNEYFEFHFRANEAADGTLYVSSDSPHAGALGTWKRRWNSIRVVRQQVSRADAASILCRPLTFKVTEANVVTGNAGGTGDGNYAIESRLVAPDYPYYIKEVRLSDVRCPEKK